MVAHVLTLELVALVDTRRRLWELLRNPLVPTLVPKEQEGADEYRQEGCAATTKGRLVGWIVSFAVLLICYLFESTRL